MRNLTRLLIASACCSAFTMNASAQQTPDPVDMYQLRYQSNLPIGDGIVILTPTPTASPAAKTSVAPAANPVKPVGSPATSASPATTNVPIQGSQVNEAAHIAAPGTYNFGASYSGDANKGGSPGSGTITPSKNIPIQGSQVNEAAHATGTGTVPITPGKNITIENSRAQANNLATGTPGNTGNVGDAGNGGFNQHPGHKIKNKGHGQLSNAGTAGDDDGRKLHTGGQGDGWHKKQQQMQTQGQVSQEGGQGGNGQRQHHQQQVQSTQPQPGLRAWGTTVHAGNADSAGDGGKKGKPKPTPTPR